MEEPKHVSQAIRHWQEHIIDPDKRREVDTLFVRADKVERDWLDRMQAERIARNRKDARIPQIYLESLEHLEETDSVAQVRAFLAEPKVFLLMCGDTGVGKSVAACWALEQKGGLFVEASILLCRPSWDDEHWDPARDARILVIDDLGAEQAGEKNFENTNLLSLMSHRYADLKKTIITTNMTWERFKLRYASADGGRTIDRLRDAGRVFSVSGRSLRSAQRGEPKHP
jgi:hypothetical protein